MVVFVLLMFAHGCEHVVDQTVSFPPPLGNVALHSFSVLEWITTPHQEIRIELQQQSDVGQLVDLRVFGDFQPEMTEEIAVKKFGKPERTRTDDFGGDWTRYATPLGYVELGLDRRTSSTDDDKGPSPGRRSLRGYTRRPTSEIFRPPLLEVLHQAEKMIPRADAREFNFFNAENRLIMDIWVKKGQVEHMELFQHVDR
jgi:hypothetical protein